jgi:sulfite exporter TauE/SafE
MKKTPSNASNYFLAMMMASTALSIGTVGSTLDEGHKLKKVLFVFAAMLFIYALLLIAFSLRKAKSQNKKDDNAELME